MIKKLEKIIKGLSFWLSMVCCKTFYLVVRLMKKNMKYFWVAVRFSFILVIPYFIYIWMFEPSYIKELPQSNEINETLSPPELSTCDTIRTVISEIIEAPLGLGFRDFCVKNYGILWINEKLVTKEQSELSGAGIAEVTVKINEGRSDNFAVKPGDEHCVTFIKKDDQIRYEFSEKKTIVKPEDSILRKYFLPNTDITQPEYKISINFGNIKFFYKKNIYDNWAKGVIFFIFWESLLILVIKIYKFLRFGYKKV